MDPRYPPYMKDENGFCYITTPDLIALTHLTSWFGAVDKGGYAKAGTEPKPRWLGETVVCLASGPSLTIEDCEYVKAAQVRVITVNDTFKRASWADVFLAADHGWWQQHRHEIVDGPEWWTCSYEAIREYPELALFRTNLNTRNTGAKAIEMAIDFGASKVILLGFDCTLSKGIHWHGPHQRTSNPDDNIVVEWHAHFKTIAEYAKSKAVPIINCSRDTAIECFERAELEDVL